MYVLHIDPYNCEISTLKTTQYWESSVIEIRGWGWGGHDRTEPVVVALDHPTIARSPRAGVPGDTVITMAEKYDHK